MLAQDRAWLAASTFLPKQGTSTRFATGSQIIPRIFCRAIEAALTVLDQLFVPRRFTTLRQRIEECWIALGGPGALNDAGEI